MTDPFLRSRLTGLGARDVTGEADACHVVLRDTRVGAAVLPELGVFVLPDEVALDYRMGPEWRAEEVAALFTLLRTLLRRGGCVPHHDSGLP